MTARRARDRVVAADVDPPVVREQAVDHRSEARDGVVVVVRDRLVAAVGAGHDERAAHSPQQEVVERRVREEQAQVGEPRRDSVGHGSAGAARCEHDGTPPVHQGGDGARVEVAQVPRVGEVADHHRERLVVARLAAAQIPHRGRVGGVDREVVAADALHRHQPTGSEQLHRGPQRLVTSGTCRAVGCAPGEPGSALGTGVGLRMEAPVPGVVVLAPARVAHDEARHRRRRPVVRHAQHDRVARAAVRAVRERVAVAPVGRIVDLGEAVGARRGVDAHGHCSCRTRIVARHDAERARPAEGLGVLERHRPHRRERRRVLDEEPRQFRDARRARPPRR